MRRGAGQRCHGYAVAGGGVYCARRRSDRAHSSQELWWHPPPSSWPGSDDLSFARTAHPVPRSQSESSGPRPWVDDDWDHIHDYQQPHETGTRLLFQVLRKGSGRSKVISQRRPDPECSKRWIFDLGDALRGPYRWPELTRAAANRGSRLWIAEGEKSVDALVKAGVIATTTPGGAHGWGRAREHCLPIFRCFADVNIVRDYDDDGLRYSHEIRADLEAAGVRVRILLSATTRCRR